MNNLIKTLSFFDLFNYPLTAWELWRWSRAKKNYGDFLTELNSYRHAHIKLKHGFYYLAGREDLLTTRQTRYTVSEKKCQRARRLAWWLARLPWINLVCLANQVGAHNLRAAGDIDLFIVTKAKRLWLSRLLATGVLKLLNLRPRADKTQDTFCLSFWVSAEHLDLNDFRLPSTDLYFTYWLTSLTPLFDAADSYRKLLEANAWLNETLPNWQAVIPNPRHLIKPKTSRKKSGWRKVDWLEARARDWQIKHLPSELSNLANLDTRVIVNDAVAKLHATDRREEFLDKYQEKISKF